MGPAAGPPSLVVGTRGDPVTPLAGSERVTTQLGSATLVTWLGAGHGAYPATPCIRDAVGRLPARRRPAPGGDGLSPLRGS